MRGSVLLEFYQINIPCRRRNAGIYIYYFKKLTNIAVSAGENGRAC